MGQQIYAFDLLNSRASAVITTEKPNFDVAEYIETVILRYISSAAMATYSNFFISRIGLASADFHLSPQPRMHREPRKKYS